MVERSVPLSATHNGVAGPAARPQALTRLGSVRFATPGWSETTLTRVNASFDEWSWRCLSWAPAGAAAVMSSTNMPARAASSAVGRRRDRFIGLLLRKGRSVVDPRSVRVYPDRARTDFPPPTGTRRGLVR